MGKPQPSEIDSSHDVDDMVYLSDDDDDYPPLSAKPGMFPRVKNLYPGERDDGRYTMSDKCPKDLPFLEETEETAKYALLIRNNKCYDGRRQLSISSIVIQNPALKKVVSRVLKDYPSMNPNLDRLEIISPFRPFVHRWQCLTDALITEQDPETKSLIQLFYDALEQELRWILEAREDFISHNTIAFGSLWMIFEPGTIILTTLNRRRAAGRLKSASFYSGRYEEYYRLEYEFITWNGQMFGWNTHRLDIREFEGLKKITDLNVFPLKFHPRADKVKKELIDMGREFEKLKGFHHKQYEGIALSGSNPFYVDSRVIIDANTFNSFNPDQISILEPVAQPCGDKDYDEPASDRTIGRDWKKAPAIPELSDVPSLTEEQLMLCVSTVKGYSLRNKRWLDFFVDSLKEIRWKDNAMSDVVLGTEQRHLVYSVVKNYTERTAQNKGMNFLISGDSGVGKTMAVESAAECLHAPVFHLTNADIELEPDNPDLENPFTDILEMCANWKAVVLYDSADKALDRNRVDDSENEESVDLVSFLHALESHFSLLFVTTTLEISPEVIGPRLLSRFHFTTEIPYPDTQTRKAIWEKHLQTCGVSVFANPTALARWALNGREIANAVIAAKMLAGGGNLTTPFLESVVPNHKRLDYESDLSDGLVDEIPRDDGWDYTYTEKRVKKPKSKKPMEDAPPLPLAAEERCYDFQDSDRSKYKENIEVKPPSPGESKAAPDLPPSPRPLEDDWAFWGTSKKGKKKAPTEKIPKASDEPADADVWGSWGTSIKSKKTTPAEPEKAPAPVDDLAVDKPAVAEEDMWGTFGVKKDKKKKKKPAAPVEPEILSVPADPPADVEPAKLLEPAADELPTVDGWGFAPIKDKKKKKPAAPVELEMSGDPPAEAAVEVEDVWAFGSSKKDKKKKKRAAPVEEQGAVADDVLAEPPVNPVPAVSSNDGWGAFWGQGR